MRKMSRVVEKVNAHVAGLDVHKLRITGGEPLLRRGLDRAGVEGLHLEGAERAVPDQGLRPREDRDDMRDALRADIEDHFVGVDMVDIHHARGRVRLEFLCDAHIDRQHDFAHISDDWDWPEAS